VTYTCGQGRVALREGRSLRTVIATVLLLGSGCSEPSGSDAPGVSGGTDTVTALTPSAGGSAADVSSDGITSAGTPAGEEGPASVAGGVPLAGGPSALAATPGASAAADAGSDAAGLGGPPIVDLFNGTDLTGWSAYRQTSQDAPGSLLSALQAEQIFKPENGTIRVYGDEANGSTQARHTLVSDGSYSRYNFWLEYSWGTKVFAPYTDLVRYPRDAGILFHIHGDQRVVWPSSIEFQIKEGTTGDIFALYARCTSLALANGTTFVDAQSGGTNKLVNGANGFVQHGRSANFELPGWNSLELQVDGGAARYLVNGHLVNQIVSVADRSGTTGVPISAGPIALQSEHAEVFYRNVRIQVLP
jgi:Domain of Unknown Function (DUF1080)